MSLFLVLPCGCCACSMTKAAGRSGFGVQSVALPCALTHMPMRLDDGCSKLGMRVNMMGGV
jgi:hypothetical protein